MLLNLCLAAIRIHIKQYKFKNMKTKLFMIMLFCTFAATSAQAQITLDTVFNYGYPAGPSYNLIRLEKSGFKWLIMDTAYTATLLNMDHSVFKQFSMTLDAGFKPSVFYMTEVLFNTDSTNVEFMLSYFDQAASHRWVKIWDESGNLLFSRDSSMAAPWFGSGYSPNMLNGSITNTDSGAVMVLIRNEGALNDLHNEVYRMPGYLECSACVDPLRLMQPPLFVKPFESLPAENGLKAFPNPSAGSTTIEYNLPAKYSKGELNIVDMQGNLIRSYKISNLSKSIIIEKGAFPTGTYYCIIKSGEELISRKFIRIN